MCLRDRVLRGIFSAGLVGFAIVKLGDRVAGARRLMGEASEIMIQVTRFVLEFTPIGTFGLIAALVGGYGFEQLRPLLMFVVALYAACAFHIVVVYGGLLLAHGPNPLKFFRGAFPGMQVGFVASSSFAAMPVSLLLLYTSDAADAMQCVDLGGSRIIKKKRKEIRT